VQLKDRKTRFYDNKSFELVLLRLCLVGLFHKLILESGVGSNPWSFNEWMDTGFRLAKKLGKTTSDAKVAYEFLKKIDAKTLVENSQWPIATEEVSISIVYYLFFFFSLSLSLSLFLSLSFYELNLLHV